MQSSYGKQILNEFNEELLKKNYGNGKTLHIHRVGKAERTC